MISPATVQTRDKFDPFSKYPTNILITMFEHVAEGIMITNNEKKIISVNPAFTFVTGYTADEVIGRSPSVLQSGVHDNNFYNSMWSCIRKNGMWQGEIWNRRKTGDIYPEWLSIIPVKDAEGNVTNYCGIFTDLSERKYVEHELKRRTVTDLLTDVNNRFSYIERMNALLESSAGLVNQVQHAVFFLNVDRFKQINDTLGHGIADKILVELAKRIKKMLKNKDIIARYGGDEFVVTLTNIAYTREAAIFVEELIQVIEAPMSIEGHEIFISASIGISLYPLDGMSTEELISRANKARAYSKQKGPHGYAFYIDELDIDSKRVLLLDAEIRKAIENREFTLYYQPKVCVNTNEIIGVEALVRWQNDKLGFVSPAEFIPYAEETGLIIPLSEIIFDEACKDLKILQREGYTKIPIAVNISSIHFQQQNFLESMKEILEKNKVSAQNFQIEVTERTVMNNSTETVNKLVLLKQLGFRIAIDDFGTGYSSLSYLIRFPLDVLKIDHSFIQHICSLDDKQAIVDAIIQMAHRLKMQVVAEGVESKQQVELLKKMNCDFIQGFYYSKPIPLNELFEFLEFWKQEHQGRV